MNAVNVVNLFARFKTLDKCPRNKAMHQKCFASFCAGRAIAKPHLNVWFSTSSIFFGA